MMRGMGGLGRVLMLAGAVLFLLGAAAALLERAGLGRLPGDIVVRRENFTLYLPIVTSLLLSAVLTGILWLLRR
jgi:hypothetical protein